MYIHTSVEKFLNGSREIIDLLHKDQNKENIVLNTRFKVCHFPAHADNLSLKFTFTGKEFYEYGKRKVSVSPTNFLLINQGQEHESWIESKDWVNSFAIYFTPSFAAEVYNDLHIPDEKLLDDPYGLIDQSGTICFFQNMFHFNNDFMTDVSSFKTYLETTGGKEQMGIDEWLRYLLSKFIRIHQTDLVNKMSKVVAVKNSTKIEILKRVHLAREFIESFYTQELSLRDIASCCFLSENLLLRYFKSIFGMSPHQYLMNRRLELAKEYLETSDMTFNEITIVSGFRCPSSFGRLFKTRYGITPNHFRAQQYFQKH